MAIRGRRPTATIIKLATGNPGNRPLPQAGPEAAGSPLKPPKLRGRAATLWDEVVERAPWLTVADSYKLHVWCVLQAEFERAPRQMVAAMISQLRSAGSELGLDPGSRARLGQVKPNGAKKDAAEKYFSG
jgi:hypothetical protein